MNPKLGLAALFAACALVACGGSDDATPPAPPPAPAPAPNPGIDRIEPLDTATLPRKAAERASAPQSQWPAGLQPAVVELGPLAPTKAVLAQSDKGLPQQIGVARDVAATADRSGLAQLLRWLPTADGGQVAALAFVSTGAQAVRLGVWVQALPEGAVLRFYDADRASVVEVSARQAMQQRQDNEAAGLAGDAARMLWGPDTGGATSVLEVQLPVGVDPAAVQLAVPQLSHLLTSAAQDWVLPKDANEIGASQSCEQDVMCRGDLDPQSRAVAKLVYSSQGGTYLCSGTLMNDTRGSLTPNLLTAAHCISDQSAASTLITYWFFRAASCNSAPKLDPAFTRVTGGSRLLFTDSGVDSTLLQLNGTPPANVVYAGSYFGTGVALGAGVIGVHHPAGDLQKVSVGQIAGYANCSGGTCGGASADSGALWQVGWTQGTTEGGSSGSAIWTQEGNTRYVVGALHGGSASCQNPNGSDFYGRFDRAFYRGLGDWLVR